MDVYKFPDSDDPSALDQMRMWAAEKIAGPNFQQRYARRVAEAVEVEIYKAREEALTSTFGTAAGMNPITPRTGFSVSAPGDQLQFALDTQNAVGGPIRLMRQLQDLQLTSWVWWHIEPVVGNILATWTALVIGNGIDIQIEESQRRLDGRNAADAWAEFDEKNDYSAPGGMVWEAVFNTFLFGEWFNWFLGPRDGESMFPTAVRGLDPISRGGIQEVETDPNDFRRVLAYKRRGAPFDPIPPEQVNHWKLVIGGNQVRGRPLVERSIDDIFRLQQTRLSTWIIQEFRMRLSTLRYIRNSSKAAPLPPSVKTPKPLTIQDIPEGASVEEPDLRKTTVGGRNDNTAERLLLTAIAQGVFLPYHIVAQEFREANLASLIAAEGPTAKMAEFFASRFERFIREDVRRVIGDTQPNGQPLEMNAAIKPVVIRDEHKERESWGNLRANREISQMTLHEKIGLDPDLEQERLADEAERTMERAAARNPLGSAPGEGRAAEALDDLFSEVTAIYENAGRPYGQGRTAALTWWRDQNGGTILPPHGGNGHHGGIHT